MAETSHSERMKVRLKRLNRWERPLRGVGDRLIAWINALFVDHAFIRLVYLNRHKITPRAWRAAQPAPHQIRAMAADGIRTIVSLRGGQTFGSLPLEKEAIAAAGMNYDRFVLRSRSLPTPEEIEDLKAFLDGLEYPVLFHCKSGADRAGFMSAMYLILQEETPVRKAIKQLSSRYGHIKQGKTGVLDAFFETYLQDTNGEIPLLEWVQNHYDRDKVMAGFEPSGWGTLITDVLLRRE
ncbi:MAG: sulfur transferase domain-containing protein [Pseudomonadota bacterium]